MKFLSLLLVIVLLFSITSCTTASNNTTSNSKSNSTATCNHTWNPATCINPKTCSKCSKTEGDALGHTSVDGVCSRCGENLSEWEVGEYTDEFDQPTGKNTFLLTDRVHLVTVPLQIPRLTRPCKSTTTILELCCGNTEEIL